MARALTLQRQLELKRALAVTSGMSGSNGLITASAAGLLDDFLSNAGVLTPAHGETELKLATANETFAVTGNTDFKNAGIGLTYAGGAYSNALIVTPVSDSSTSGGIVGFALEGAPNYNNFIDYNNDTYNADRSGTTPSVIMDLGSALTFSQLEYRVKNGGQAHTVSMSVAVGVDDNGSVFETTLGTTSLVFTTAPYQVLTGTASLGSVTKRYVKITFTKGSGYDFHCVELHLQSTARASNTNTVDADFVYTGAKNFSPASLKVYSDAGATELTGSDVKVDYSLDNGATYAIDNSQTTLTTTLTNFRLLAASLFDAVGSGLLRIRLQPIGTPVIHTATIGTQSSELDMSTAGLLYKVNDATVVDLSLALQTTDLDTDVALAANSDTKIATQKATKAYAISAAENAVSLGGYHTTIRRYLQTANTSDNTIATVPVAADSALYMSVRILGINTAGTAMSSESMTAMITRKGTDAAFVVGSPVSSGNYETSAGSPDTGYVSATTHSIGISVSTNDAIVTVKDTGGGTIKWIAEVEYFSVTKTTAA